MVISQTRLAHSISGRIYLAEPGVQLLEYKRVCRQAYGDLRGVQFHEFPSGTRFQPGQLGHYWTRA